MQCSVCNGIYQEKRGIQVNDPYIGTIIIKDALYYECKQCNTKLYTLETSQAIEVERAQRLQERVSDYPIRDFINATQTALMLGITRQALSKNHRIKKGFIYQIRINREIFYLKQSVLQYKKTGDGRFPLYASGNKPIQYITDTVQLHSPAYVHHAILEPTPSFKITRTSIREALYGN